ncbi:TapB family protein [Hymenobacter sediminicola]|uniref:DUF3108 domain-containing protein n=1 Tax=Hymenobacter sediminicola TaxID=2761579 RepID=A0A7G7W2F8_9BACT|nr:hypothetical protein [Hymenobacter sediminicola]QNH60551.1 hypothetical protein H4317_10080 [Hymenobacter sediminicola]
MLFSCPRPFLLISVLTLTPSITYAQTTPAAAESNAVRPADRALLSPAIKPAAGQPFGLSDNTELVYRLLDANGKPAGELHQRVVRLKKDEREESKKQVVTEQTALLKSGLYDKKNILVTLQDLTFRARRDTSFTDGMACINQDALRSFRDRKIAYAPVALAWPDRPTVGTDLPDGGVTINVSSSVVSIANVSTTLRKRRVVGGPTPLTTPAGTFSCYKVESEREEATVPRPDMAMRSTTKQVDFYAPGVGIIRTERYTKGGKLEQVQELTSRTTSAGATDEKVKYKAKKS